MRRRLTPIMRRLTPVSRAASRAAATTGGGMTAERAVSAASEPSARGGEGQAVVGERGDVGEGGRR